VKDAEIKTLRENRETIRKWFIVSDLFVIAVCFYLLGQDKDILWGILGAIYIGLSLMWIFK
jgi:hypothetical protein